MMVRIFNPFGPGQPIDYVVPRFIDLAKRDLPLTLNNKGFVAKDYINIQDVATGFIAAGNQLLDDPGYRMVKLGTGVKTKIKDIAKMIFEELDVPSNIEYIEDERRRNEQDSPSISKEDWPKNWQFTSSIRDGIKEMCR